MTPLLNELAGILHDFVLVLDDYHMLDSNEIDTALTFLIDNQPPQMNLVITTREDPRLPLSRLRARGRLTELRAADLRFTPDEAADFLNTTMGLSLSPDDVAALEQRTEGWVAGLQLAAISMQGQANKAQFLEAFTGSHRYIMDYLLEEVLSQQTADMRRFLLQTSILDRLNGDLCDAVTGQTGSHVILEQLERRNLFVIAMDHLRDWFRYHHLFADVLRARLKRESPEVLTTIHQRASHWYEENASMPDAIRHAFLAEDDPLASRLLELVWSEMDLSYQSSRWFRWGELLPKNIILERPVMCLGYAWALVNQGDFQAGERYLEVAQRYVDRDLNDLVVHDIEQWKMLPSAILSARAYIAMATVQIDQTIHYAKESLALSTNPLQTSQRQASALLGFASWASGDLQSADTALENYLLSMNYLGSAIIAYIADLRIQLGRLRDAQHIYQDGLGRIDDFPSLGTEELYRGLAEFHLELGDLDQARNYLDKSKSLGEHMAILTWQQRYCVTEAQYHALLGDSETALEQLDFAQAHYLQTAMPDIRPLSAQKARIWIRQDRLSEVERWAQQQGDSPSENLHYLKEFEHITLAWYYMAQYRHRKEAVFHEQAHALLALLLSEAETGARLRSTIEIQMLQAELAALSDDLEAGLRILDTALDLAESQGYVALFIMEGDNLKSLLQRSKHPYARRLLAAFPEASKSPSYSQVGLIESLSDRELEILNLVAEGLSNREIGERLFLALDTIKGHNRRIYAKLGVQRRTEAIARARDLGLI